MGREQLLWWDFPSLIRHRDKHDIIYSTCHAAIRRSGHSISENTNSSPDPFYLVLGTLLSTRKRSDKMIGKPYHSLCKNNRPVCTQNSRILPHWSGKVLIRILDRCRLTIWHSWTKLVLFCSAWFHVNTAQHYTAETQARISILQPYSCALRMRTNSTINLWTFERSKYPAKTG